MIGQDIVTVRVGGHVDPDGAQLEKLLAAQFAYERSQQARRRWTYVLAITVLAMWIGGPSLGRLLPAQSGTLAAAQLSLWLCTAGACLGEWRRYRHWKGLLSAHPAAELRAAQDF